MTCKRGALILCMLQAQGLDPDDPTNSYMLQAGARLCKCLGEEFVPYLSVVMPPLLETAEVKPDISVQEDSDVDGDEDDEDDEVRPRPGTDVWQL